MNALVPYAKTLESPPGYVLGPWLAVLARLLEAGAQLKFGFFGGQSVPAEDRAALSKGFEGLAQGAFERALRVSPRAVGAWLDSLNDLQKPAAIDFAAWRARTTSSPDAPRSLPPPPEPLVEAVTQLRSRAGVKAAPAVSEGVLLPLLDALAFPIADELVAFFQLTGGLTGALGDETTFGTPSVRPYASLETIVRLTHRRVPYEYRVLPSGAVEQTRGAEGVVTEPRPIAASLAGFLRLLGGAPGPWVPAPELQLTGVAPPALTVQEVQANRAKAVRSRELAAGLASLDTPDSEPVTVERAFERLHTWASTNAPQLANAFAPPASRASVARVEARLEGALPAGLATLYGLHDGERRSFFARFSLLSIEQALAEHRPFPANGAWFPVVIHGSSSVYDAVSLDARSLGQVVSVEKGLVGQVIASDLGAYFTRFARALERDWATVEPGRALQLHPCFWSTWD